MADDVLIHVVRKGEYLTLLAKRYGVPADRIWNHAANAALRNKRKSPNILFPGDELAIPVKQLKYAEGATEKKHEFLLKGARQKVRMQLKDRRGKPLANAPFTVTIPGLPDITGKAGKDGTVEVDVPVDAQDGKLVVHGLVWDLAIGHLDPISRYSGIQQRLKNLGFDPGSIDGRLSAETKAALARFQESVGLEPTGIPDDRTRAKLEEKHEGTSRGLPLEEEAQPEPPKPQQVAEETGADEPVEPLDAALYDDPEAQQ